MLLSICYEFLMAYSRALIKLSGEALMGEKPYGIDPEIVQSIARMFQKWLKMEHK